MPQTSFQSQNIKGKTRFQAYGLLMSLLYLLCVGFVFSGFWSHISEQHFVNPWSPSIYVTPGLFVQLQVADRFLVEFCLST